jgi:hypothetical protein
MNQCPSVLDLIYFWSLDQIHPTIFIIWRINASYVIHQEVTNNTNGTLNAYNAVIFSIPVGLWWFPGVQWVWWTLWISQNGASQSQVSCRDYISRGKVHKLVMYCYLGNILVYVNPAQGISGIMFIDVTLVCLSVRLSLLLVITTFLIPSALSLNAIDRVM